MGLGIKTLSHTTSGSGGGGGSGTVTSVDMTVPAFLAVSGNPVTTSGTLAVTLSGTALPVANGGTGQTSYTNGQLLIGNTTGNTLTKATLTAGTGISVTNGGGSITITNTGSASAAFTTIQTDAGTNPVASGATDTLTLTSTNLTITGDSSTDTVTFAIAAVPNTATVTVKDSNFTVQNASDTTKQFKLDASGITTGTTRTMIIPDANFTAVGTATTQSLSNKTLGNTNTVTLKDTLFTLQDDGDTTKQAQLQLSSITTGTTRTLTVQDANYTIGDTSTNTSTSVDSEIALFSSTGGKTLKRATGTGYAKITSGVLSAQSTPIPLADGGTNRTTALAARDASGLNIDQRTAVADADYTILATDRTVGLSSITATRTFTLPAANAVNAGQELKIIDESGGLTSAINLIVQRAGSDTINGATSSTFAAARTQLILVSDGTSKWNFDVQGITRGGTGQTTRATAFNALSPLTTQGDVIYYDGSNNVRLGPGTSGQFLKTQGAAANPIWANASAGAATMTRTAKTSNYTLVAGDQGNIIAFTGSTTITFAVTAAATLGSGWWCIVENAGTGAANNGQLVVDPNSSETIDGVTTLTTYPGDVRIINCDGSNFTTELIEGGYVQYTVAGANTFTVPTRVTQFYVEVWGAGGGGGGGSRQTDGAARVGGSGGGGGACVYAYFTGAALSTSQTVTIGTGGNAGTGATADGTNGVDGSAGGNTTLGSLLTAYGGAGGFKGTGSAATSGGSGGGWLTAGVLGGTTAKLGGEPRGSQPAAGQFAGQFGGGDANLASGSAGSASAFGGASGGGCNGSVTGQGGGNSVKGGAGGGGAAGLTAGNGANSAAAGGASGATGQGAASGSGGGAGTSGASPTAGTAGSATPSNLGPDVGGGGGGAGSSTTGGASCKGGNGGVACGGGGGGSTRSGQGVNAGDGGSGGAGLCRIWYA